MSVKVSRRIVSIFLALTMILSTFAFGAFAASSTPSSAQGTTQSNYTKADVAEGTIAVSGAKKLTVTVNGKKVEVSGNTIENLKNGDLVVIKTEDGKSYRWFTQPKKVKKSNGGRKLSWSKVKKTSWYVVEYTDKKGKTKYQKVSSKKTSYTVGKGCKVKKVRPCIKKGKKVYAGIWKTAK